MCDSPDHYGTMHRAREDAVAVVAAGASAVDSIMSEAVNAAILISPQEINHLTTTGGCSHHHMS